MTVLTSRYLALSSPLGFLKGWVSRRYLAGVIHVDVYKSTDNTIAQSVLLTLYKSFIQLKLF